MNVNHLNKGYRKGNRCERKSHIRHIKFEVIIARPSGRLQKKAETVHVDLRWRLRLKNYIERTQNIGNMTMQMVKIIQEEHRKCEKKRIPTLKVGRIVVSKGAYERKDRTRREPGSSGITEAKRGGLREERKQSKYY